jgi:hypothetical protein
VALRGFAVFGETVASLSPSSPPQVPHPLLALVSVLLTLGLIAGVLLFAGTTTAKTRARERVREFALACREGAAVLVDGKPLPADPVRALIESLADIEAHRKVGPGSKSHPVESFLVVLTRGDARMTLELSRDSRRRREYWVFLLGEGSHRELNDVGRIVTDVLDGFVPLRPDKRKRNLPWLRNPGN